MIVIEDCMLCIDAVVNLLLQLFIGQHKEMRKDAEEFMGPLDNAKREENLWN
jgi:hypothetical protein